MRTQDPPPSIPSKSPLPDHPGRRGPLSAAFLVAAAACLAAAQSVHLEAEITSLSPSFYWSLESSLWSQIPAGSSNSVTFGAYEKEGASLLGDNGTLPSPAVFMEMDYLPILPAHMNAVPSSNGAILGESDGVLDGVVRYLELPYGAFGDEPLDALGMALKYEWSMHLMVSPDLGARAAETVFHAGDADDFVKLEVDVDSTTTTYSVHRRAAGVTHTATVTVTNSTDPRQWDQVIARYDQVPGGPFGTTTYWLMLDVNGSADSVVTSGDVTANTPGSAVVGMNNNLSSGAFNGAVHHLAVWNRSLSATEVSDLAGSVPIAPTARAALEIDWNADVRFHTWAVPSRNDELGVGERSLRDWQDSIWEHPDMYPMVRFRTDNYAAGYVPPGASAPTVPVQTSQIVEATLLWIDYINNNLPTPKSLSDGSGYSVYWHNLFEKNPVEPYNDYDQYEINGNLWGRGRSITENWRDCPLAWREQSPGGGLLVTWNEIDIPFFREGMSQNAYRMRTILRELAEELQSSSIDPPTRLHLDIETRPHFYDAVGGVVGGIHNGWAQAAWEDPRSADPAHWAPGSSLLISILDNGSGMPAFDPDEYFYHTSNVDATRAFNHFGYTEYEYSLYNAIIDPAIRELNPDIRVSEYGMVEAGSSLDQSDVYINFATSAVEDVPLNYLDFSSPVLYPLQLVQIPSGPTLDPWGDQLGVGSLLNTDGVSVIGSGFSSAEIKEDLNTLFVEKSKHNLVGTYLAGGMSRPTAPWIVYPGHAWGDLSDKFTHLSDGDYYRVRWQDVARIVVFGYRRGVREFLWWGYDQCVDPNYDSTTDPNDFYSDSEVFANVEGMDSVLVALDWAKLSIWDMTTSGHLDRDDPLFGIPDGEVDICDATYFTDRHGEGDMEADVADSIGGIPDGIVDSYDLAHFISDFPLSSAPSCP